MADQTEEELVTKVEALEAVIKVLAQELYGNIHDDDGNISHGTAYIM